MRIGELAEKSGLSRDTIRFYERNGLIASRSGESATNNYRDYPEESLRALEFFTQAREAGMSIADLRGFVAATGGGCTPQDARAVIQQKIDEMTARAAQIETVVALLTRTLAELDGPAAEADGDEQKRNPAESGGAQAFPRKAAIRRP